MGKEATGARHKAINVGGMAFATEAANVLAAVCAEECPCACAIRARERKPSVTCGERFTAFARRRAEARQRQRQYCTYEPKKRLISTKPSTSLVLGLVLDLVLLMWVVSTKPSTSRSACPRAPAPPLILAYFLAPLLSLHSPLTLTTNFNKKKNLKKKKNGLQIFATTLVLRNRKHTSQAQREHREWQCGL